MRARMTCRALGPYVAGALVAFCVAVPALAIDTARFDEAVQAELKKSGAPSASVAIVIDGRIAYAKAFGKAHLDPDRPATATMRYKIGSVSKQFLAVALLMLQEDGKLSLGDKVGKYIPDLGPASDVTLRQLLSHTAGVRDYYPQDYVFTRMKTPITHAELIARWARQPLDFKPGERWQYSNTGYVLAAMVLEKVAGESLFSFLKRRIFEPLHMTSVMDIDKQDLPPSDATGYTRTVLGPYFPAVPEGKGWLFGAGELAMTAEDLARWDISVIDQSLMRPASYHELETEVPLANGIGSGYALGLNVKMSSEKRILYHGGETYGFFSTNIVVPDQRVAIVVLSNTEAVGASTSIANKIIGIVFERVNPVDQARLAEARAMFDGLREGRLDRSLLSQNADDYFTAEVVRDIQSSLASLGVVKVFKLIKSGTRGGMDFRVYRIALDKGDFTLVTRSLPDGKVEQFKIMPQ